MKRNIVFLLAFTFVLQVGNSQLWKLRRVELTAGAGLTHFSGDIGGYPRSESLLGLRNLSLKQTGLDLSAGIRYRLLVDLSVRANVAFGYFHASDAHGAYKSRDYASTTAFLEPAILGEFYILRNKLENSYLFVRGKRDANHSFFSSVDLYVFAGIGAIYYDATPNPVLFPLATERTGLAPVIPVGIGAARNTMGNKNFGIEAGARYVFSDEIEGFAPPGSNSNDMYYCLNFVMTWKVKTRKMPHF